jgi:hypothetical protein
VRRCCAAGRGAGAAPGAAAQAVLRPAAAPIGPRSRPWGPRGTARGQGRTWMPAWPMWMLITSRMVAGGGLRGWKGLGDKWTGRDEPGELANGAGGGGLAL